MVHAGIIPAQWQSVVDELHEAQQRIRSLEGVRDKLLTVVEDMREENKKLQGVIAAHDLCHDQHGKVDACAFAAGCVAEQKRIYGHSPHEAALKELELQQANNLMITEHEITQLKEELKNRTDGIDSLTTMYTYHKDRIQKLEEENRRLRERCPMTVQEICERADAAEAAACRYQQVVEQGDGTAQEVVDGAQPGGLQPPEQAG